MRLPRSIQLYDTQGFVHQFWRCHNKEFYLSMNSIKNLYLRCIQAALKKYNKDSSLKINAYTVMDNHFHNLIQYCDGALSFSNFLRQAHSLFGIYFNKIHKRSGKVAEGRPKTSLIENIEHLMRVHFYIEANPIRAGRCTLKSLKNYRYSSYRFYAYGITDEFCEILTVPQWYLDLGITAKQRQAKYRSLFQNYIEDVSETIDLTSKFIGSLLWQLSSVQRVRLLLEENQPAPSG